MRNNNSLDLSRKKSIRTLYKITNALRPLRKPLQTLRLNQHN